MVPQASNLNLKGKNLAGIAMEIDYLKQLILLKKLKTQIENVAIIYTPNQSGHTVSKLKLKSKSLDIRIKDITINSPHDLQKKLNTATDIDAFFMISDRNALNLESIQMTLDFAYKTSDSCS